MKILRKKNCGFTIIEILVVLSIIAALIGIAGKKLMPRNPLVDDDILKISDFFEKCVFEFRILSLRFFERYTYKSDGSEKEVEFFMPGFINITNFKPRVGTTIGVDSKGHGHFVIAHVRDFYIGYYQKLDSYYNKNVLSFNFPKLRKKISNIEEGIFSKEDKKFSKYNKELALRDVRICGMPFYIAKKKNTFSRDNWNTFFDGFFMAAGVQSLEDERFLCWEVTFDGKEKWCFYVDDLCICHSVKM